MRFAVLVCLILAMAGSPLAAQQTVPAEPPPASELPPPTPQRSTELPPPFPHYPARAPREHDPNYHPHAHRKSGSTHHAKTHHRAASRHASHHKGKTHHATKQQRAKSKGHAKRVYFSKRTIRQCHAMSYKQIMAHRYCRTMMKQELAAQPTHHAQHRKAAHSRKSRRHRR